MDQYPLCIKIPRAETNRSTIGFRHTEYVIEIDDCGKVYIRLRRFNTFVWLHEKLRRRELACALPELPPKKIFGTLDTAFVDRRRQMLEDYLRALLRLKEVVQDDSIWAFLDADEATAVVPRFLCRPTSHSAADRCLAQLKRAVADREAEIFRLCSPVVLQELSNFALAEAAEAAVQAPSQPTAQQALQARLSNRVRLCGVMHRLIVNERARQGLVTSGAFGALLALLWRVTEDEIAAAPTQRYADNLHRAACLAVTDCLKRLIQESKGAALLHFCQQDDALNALKKLASAEALALHPVAASLLWHGMQCNGVITALAGSSTRGLSVLGRLLSSADRCSRVLAALCIGSVVRQDGALDDESREHCLQALAPIPADIESSEAEAVQRAAAASLTQPAMLKRTASGGLGATAIESRASSQREATEGTRARGMSSSAISSDLTAERVQRATAEEATASVIEAVSKSRDAQLMKLLEEIFNRQEFPRIQSLLGPCWVTSDDDEGHHFITVDTVTAVMVALLDVYVQHCLETDPQSLRELASLVVPQLHLLVEGDDDGPLEGGVGGSAAVEPPATQISRDEVRTKAAQILVRLNLFVVPEGSGREPPALSTFGPRAQILEVLTRKSAHCQEVAASRIASANERCAHQVDRIQTGGLDQAPCLDQAQVEAFNDSLRGLTARRSALGLEVGSSRQAVEETMAGLDRRRIKLGILNGEVDQIARTFSSQSDQALRSNEVQMKLKSCEDHFRSVQQEVEALQLASNEAQASAREWAVRAQKAEALASELAGREAELAEIRNCAPAHFERLQARLVDVSRRRLECSKMSSEFLSEVDRIERRASALRDARKEAEVALKNLSDAGQELEVIKKSLHSEIILSNEEILRIRKIYEKMTPTLPTRTRERRYSEDGAESDGAVSSTSSSKDVPPQPSSDPPLWDDIRMEQEFRDSPNYRTLKALKDERLNLWNLEKKWLLETSDRIDASKQELLKQHRQAEQASKNAVEEEEQLKRELAVVDDSEGHASRHDEACAESRRAQDLAREASNEAAKAAGNYEYAKARLEMAEAQADEAAALLQAARVEADGVEGKTLQVRDDLERRFSDIERRIRDYMQEWRSMEFDEQRLFLLQEKVNERLRQESTGRQALREEVHRLIANLQDLDRQLDCTLDSRAEHEDVFGIPSH